MAKKINSRDLFEQEDLFRGVRDSADKTIQKLTQLKEGMVASAKEMKAAFSGLKMDNLKDLEKFVKLAEQANKLSKQSIEVDKQKKVSTEQKKKSELELLKIEQEKEKLKQQQMRTNKMVTTEQERQNKQAEKQKKLAQDQANAYKKLEKNTRDLKNESKRLGAEMLALEQKGRKNTAEYNKLAQEYNKVTRAAQKGDQQLKKLDKTVGDNFRNVGNYKSALAGLSGALGTLGIAFGAGQIFRSTFGILANFDQAQADLAAISGKSKDELAGLTAQAKELGATTQFSATQITEMQTELAKLGFSTDQISDSTEAVSNFAAATGADIPRAAALAGSALRAFNLPATEMERVVSTLGVATTKSALDFSKLEAGLSTVAPVAASFGFSIEDTTALLGQLSNAGFDASSAATATRNILLNLADSTGDLAQELGRPIKNADDLAAALQELDARGIDLAESLELTDKRSVAAFNTFIKQSGSLVQLRDSITDVNDELKDMAAKRLDSIQCQLTLLSSAWEGFILGTNDSTGASEKLKVAIGFLAENLSRIMDVVIRLIRFWAVYKTTTIAVNQVNKLMAINFSNVGRSIMAMIPGTKAYTVQMRAMRIAGQKTNVSLKVLGQTMKRMPWGLVIAGATELYFALKGDEEATDDLASSTDKAKQETEDFASRLADSTSEFISHIEQLKNTNYESEERIKLIDEMNKKYGTHLQNIKDETAFQVQLNQAVADYLAFQKLRLRSEIGKEKSKEAMQQSFEASETLLQQFGNRLTEEQQKIVVATGDLPIEIMREFMGAQKMIAKGYGANDKNIQRLLERGQEVYNLQAQIKQANIALQRYAVSELEIQEALKNFNYKGPAANVNNYSKSVKGAAGSVKEFNTELKGTPDYLDRQRELLFEFYEINAQAGIEATERRIKAEFEKKGKSIRDKGTFKFKEINKIINNLLNTLK